MDDQERGDTPKARPEKRMSRPEHAAALKAIRRALELNLSVMEAARDVTAALADAFEARQLAPSTARLYRRVYGRRAPGSTRTKRLRKKRLKRMPAFSVIQFRFEMQRSARVLQDVPLRRQVSIFNQQMVERRGEIEVQIDAIRRKIGSGEAVA